ncbi:MAG: cell envelope integrity EipB family protein [Alphaproteobacteria bacterium]|nr:cell envelope integrity EipB family protein [Alphaproteobacteria bacterium SS10]
MLTDRSTLKSASKPLSAVVAVLALGFGASAIAAPVSNQAGEGIADLFQPHKAIYQLKMTAVRNLQRISSVSGEMFFEWGDACEAWTTTQKFQLDYAYVEGAGQKFVSDYSSWEAKDGETFSFTSKNLSNGRVNKVYRGSAERANSGRGEADFSRPEEKQIAIPRGFLFPSEHTFKLLEAAKDGRKIFGATMFDGSDDQGPVLVNAVIGKRVDALDEAEEDNPALREPGWSVRMAFFDTQGDNSDSTSANYEMTVTLLENGIVRDLAIDYDDFSLAGELVTIDTLEPCSN